MKKKYLFVEILLALLAFAGIFIVHINGKKQTETEQKIRIMTSFYPIEIAVKNVVGDLDHVQIESLTETTVGCLHDYQLSPQDLIEISESDIFVINGGGMESFLADVIAQYPEVNIVNSSDGIILLSTEGEEETEEEHEDHDDGHEEEHSHDINAHVWMDISKYALQVDNIARELGEIDPAHKDIYEENAEQYKEKLKVLEVQAEQLVGEAEHKNIIIFHDSFAYFADAFGLDIKYILEMDENTTLSAGQVGELIDVVNEEEVDILFTEEQYGTKIADAVAKETGASVYVLDSLVTGDNDKDSYIKGMEYNLEILKEALIR